MVTAVMLNSNVRDAINFLITNRPRAVLRQTVTQSTTNGTWASITFDVEDLDNDGGHSTVTNNSRYTAQTAGWYEASGVICWAGNYSNQRQSRWTINGTVVNASHASSQVSAGGFPAYPAATVHVYLNVGDYLELQGFQNEGTVSTRVSAEQASRMNVVWIGT
jgi:hypothetical protein